MTQQQPDTSPKGIRAACLEIQKGWTPEERMRRLRVDLRPQVRAGDGRLVDVTADAYAAHLAGHIDDD